MKFNPLYIIVALVVVVALFIVGLSVHDCKTLKATTPPNSVLCSKDADCLEGQHCGFVSGYTVAVCVGQATSNQHNVGPTDIFLP